MDYQQSPTQQINQQVRNVQPTQHVQQAQYVQQAQQFQQQQQGQTVQERQQTQQLQRTNQTQELQGQQLQANQLNQPNQLNPLNQSMGLNEALGFLMARYQALDGSSRRQTGDIAQIKAKLDRLDKLDSLAGIEQLLNAFQGSNLNNVVTREEFNKAINYLHKEVVTRLNTVQQNQQLLINELRQLRQGTNNGSNEGATSFVDSKLNGLNGFNKTQQVNQVKPLANTRLEAGTGMAVKVSLPMIGDVNVNLPIPLKFVKPVVVGILIFIAILIIWASM